VSSSLRLHAEERLVRLELLGVNGYPRLTRFLLAELDSGLSSLLADPGCEGAVVHGSEKCFAAGADIAEVGALSGVSALEFARRAQLLFERIARAAKPVVAAVSGYCLGGGFDLALACRWRLAAPGAVFGHPGATLGLLTGWGGTQRLPRLLRPAHALELLLSGKQVDAEQALEIGLVDEVVPVEALRSRALKRAQQGARQPVRSGLGANFLDPGKQTGLT
jgi:enoyl-CoA hydratase/carnithine racemase